MIGDYVLHFPLTDFAVALLVIAAMIDVARRILRRPQWSATVDVLLFLGFGGALASVGSGLWLTSAGNHPHDAMLDTHHKFAYGTLAAASLAVVAKLLESRVPRLALVKTGALIISAALVSGAGFYGGKMAHPPEAAHSHGDPSTTDDHSMPMPMPDASNAPTTSTVDAGPGTDTVIPDAAPHSATPHSH